MTATAFDLARTIREVRQTGETFGVLLRRTFPVTVVQLWLACTEEDPLSRWLGRIEGDTSSGEFTLVMPVSSDDDVRTQITVLRCDQPSRLDVRWSFDGADSVVSARIEPDGSDACLTIEHFALTQESGIGCGPGWDEFLADLEDMLAGRTRQHDCGDLEQQCEALWQASRGWRTSVSARSIATAGATRSRASSPWTLNGSGRRSRPARVCPRGSEGLPAGSSRTANGASTSPTATPTARWRVVNLADPSAQRFDRASIPILPTVTESRCAWRRRPVAAG